MADIQESGQMYLETILILSETNSKVRSIDVAKYRNYSKPSVSRAVNLLKKEEYIEIDDEGNITLTPNGRELAQKIYERHRILQKVLQNLGVPEETAEEDACRIEHVISEESFEAIKNHIKK